MPQIIRSARNTKPAAARTSEAALTAEPTYKVLLIYRFEVKTTLTALTILDAEAGLDLER